MKDFGDTIGAIYESALAPESWPVALSRIAGLFDAPGAVIYFSDRDGQADFIASPGVEDAVRIYQDENWRPHDIHAQRIIDRHLTGGDVVNDQILATDHEIATLPLYSDFFARVGFGWLMAGVILPELDMLVTVSVPRARDRGAYDAAEMEILRLIGRHVEQALRISLRIANLEATETVLRAALDALESGVFTLDGQGRLAFANPAGAAQFPGLFGTIGGRVVPRSPADGPRFAALLSAVGAAKANDAPSRSCVLTRSDGGRTALWALPITPARRGPVGMAEQARVLLFAAPVGRAFRLDPAVVRDAFDLSLGEARLAALIGGGLALNAAADRLGVTEGTARVVLKRVFRKLGINRQAELVLRLSALGGIEPRRGGAP